MYKAHRTVPWTIEVMAMMHRVFQAIAGLWMVLLFIPIPVAYADSTISVTQEQIFLVPVPIHNVVQVVEVLRVKNPDATSQNVSIGLPDGYSNLSVPNTAAKNVSSDSAHVTIAKVARPNTTTDVTVVYVLPFATAQALQMTLHSDYAVDAAHIYIPIGGVALSAQNLLVSTQTVTISGTTFRQFSRLGIQPGDDWTISLQSLPTGTVTSPTIAGLPILGTDADSSGNTIAAIGNLVLAAFILVLGLVSIRSTERMLPVSKREGLMRAWTGLERQRTDGVMEELEYQRKRTEIMNKLRALPPEREKD